MLKKVQTSPLVFPIYGGKKTDTQLKKARKCYVKGYCCFLKHTKYI